MNFGRPELLILLALVPLTAGLVIYAHRRRARVLGALLSAAALADLVPSGALRARAAQAVLAVVAALGLAFAAARPQLGFEWVQRKAQGVNLVVVLDVSRSMDAQDVSPSRMETARRELIDLVGLLRGDSVGLVLVANGAYLRLPLTTDYGTFLWVLQDTSTETIAAQGTAMAGGLDTATQMLTRAGGAGKAILVVSDGEFHDPEDALAASLERVRAADIRVYSVGVGNAEGAPIPLSEGGFKKDSSGDMVLSRLNEDQLRAIALSTGGAYVRAVAGDDDMRGIYEGEIRAKLQAQEREVRREQIPHEQYQWPLAGALVSLVASAGFGIGPWKRKARAAASAAASAKLGAALLLLGLLPSPAWAGPKEEGLAAAKKEEWATAIDRLGQARVADPADVEVGQALGESLYRAGRYREAEQVFSAMAAADDDQRASHQYNAGNAAYQDGRLEQALNQFEASKAADPKFPSAGKNADAVRKEIALREQAEQEPQEGQGEPQEGQGEPQEGQGEPQEGQGEPQDGQEGEPQEGQGEPQEGQEGEPPAGQQGEPQEGEGAEGQQVEPQEGQGEPTGEGMTAAEAARLVDGVKDGRPHVSVGGRDTEKDW